MGDW
jgi:hypothetical protein